MVPFSNFTELILFEFAKCMGEEQRESIAAEIHTAKQTANGQPIILKQTVSPADRPGRPREKDIETNRQSDNKRQKLSLKNNLYSYGVN